MATGSALPTKIPPQTVPLTVKNPAGEQITDTNWYLFLYNLWLNVLRTDGGVALPPSVNIALSEIDPLVADIAQCLSANKPAYPRGFWVDVLPGANIYRIRDRLFVGEGTTHTGNRNSPFGDTTLATTIANYPEKNSQLIVESVNGRIGILGSSCLITGETSGVSIGVAGFARAQLAAGTSRALYGDATLEAGATAVYGLEISTANRGADTVANSYAGGAGVYGVKISQASAVGYLLGDASTPAPQSVSPGTAGIIIQAGPGGTVERQWNTGIIFNSNSLVGNNGVTGTSEAMSLAKGMELNWYSGSAILGATIRSDCTGLANNDTALIFSNNAVAIQGTGSANIIEAQHTANAVNNLLVRNAASGTYAALEASGSDATQGIFYRALGQSSHRFYTSSFSEELRVGGSSASPDNFAYIYGQASGNPATIAAAGADTDSDVSLKGKGAGGAMLQDGGGAIKVRINTTGVGLYGVTPVARATTAGGASTYAAGVAVSIFHTDDTYDGYTIAQVVKAMRNIGVLT